MPSFPSLSAFISEAEKMGKELEAAEKRKITRNMAERGQKIADAEAASDLGGDRAFSGWNRGRPIPLDTHIKSTSKNQAVLLPKFPGGWTTVTQGRNQGNAGGFAGPGVSRRTGRTSRTSSGALRKVRTVQAKRWNGRTSGKHTADRAQDRMERELPKVAEDGVRRVIRKHFDVT